MIFLWSLGEQVMRMGVGRNWLRIAYNAAFGISDVQVLDSVTRKLFN